MFRRARTRLTLISIALFAIVLGIFSIVFYIAFTTVLAPAFDLAPELSSEQAAEAAYRLTVERAGLALIVANIVAIAIIGVAAHILARGTLRPIREADARQRRFVADASHELRTPLAAIRTTAESALSGDPSNADLRDALATIVGASERSTRLTNDLLLLARGDEAALDRSPEPIDLSVTVAEAAEDFLRAHPGGPRPVLRLAPDIRVVADRDEVHRVIANVLDNAVRHGAGSNEAPPRIETWTQDGEAVAEVADDGPGIAAADTERIFEPFYRVTGHTRGPEGSGLGLAIAAGLARRNGGRLAVSSRPGEGARFRLILPRFR